MFSFFYLPFLPFQFKNQEKMGSMKLENNGLVKIIYELTLSTALELVNYGLQLSKDRNLALSIAVVDKSGNLLTFARMDNAGLITIDVAINKAKTSAYIKAPSKAMEGIINSGELSLTTIPNILPIQGGVPVIYNDEVIGAIGVSGSTGEIDNEIATQITQYLNKQ